MSQGWMRVRDAAHLMGVSQSTVRRRVDSGELRGKVGKSGRQEVFLPVKMRRELEARHAESPAPGHLDRGKSVEEADAEVVEREQQLQANAALAGELAGEAADAPAPEPEPSGEVLKKFERLAGGSLILAQQRSDELQKHTDSAYEQLAHTRSQVRQLRKVALLGWAGCAAALVFGTVLSVTFGLGMAKAKAEARVSEAHADQALHSAERMSQQDADTPISTPETAATDAPADDSATASWVPSVGAPQGPFPAETRRGRASTGRTVSVPTE